MRDSWLCAHAKIEEAFRGTARAAQQRSTLRSGRQSRATRLIPGMATPKGWPNERGIRIFVDLDLIWFHQKFPAVLSTVLLYMARTRKFYSGSKEPAKVSPSRQACYTNMVLEFPGRSKVARTHSSAERQPPIVFCVFSTRIPPPFEK